MEEIEQRKTNWIACALCFVTTGHRVRAVNRIKGYPVCRKHRADVECDDFDIHRFRRASRAV